MKAASANEIKQALKDRSHQELVDICLRLARYKKENKELMSYLLFDADDLAAYVRQVNEEIDEGFATTNTNSVYLAKKTIRKVLRIANKHIRYTGSKTAEAEIRLHYLDRFRNLNLKWRKASVLVNMYQSQIKKIKAAISGMHEDLQHDYSRQLQEAISGLG